MTIVPISDRENQNQLTTDAALTAWDFPPQIPVPELQELL
jgi:hypothetical protein